MAIAGTRVVGAIVLAYCDAPNPGFPTAPLSFSLLIGKSPDFNAMLPVPVSAEAPIRQLRYD